MKIAIIGKFMHMHDEEYIARSFEMLGHSVFRIPQHMTWQNMQVVFTDFKPEILLYMKWDCPKELKPTIQAMQRSGMKTVCWLFDLYFNYHREFHVKNKDFFKSDYVFTSDNGNQNRFEGLGINHHCIRQGIFKDECILLSFKPIKHEIVFVGSDSPVYPERTKLVNSFKADWYGKKSTNELRGIDLNELYASTRIVIGDSYPSPHYWSNRVVETLGRGGFLIHKETEGLQEEYPYLITYSTEHDLEEKIQYYKKNENERRRIIEKNFDWVKDHYTMEKQCQKILNIINQ